MSSIFVENGSSQVLGGPSTVQDRAVRVLLVEDSTTQARFIAQTLRELPPPARFDVTWVDRLDLARDRMAAGGIDIVLLDLMLPDSEGIATFAEAHAAHPELPFIVLSGAGDEAIALQAVGQGAQDYLAKGTVSPELLTRSIRYALERHRTLEALRQLALVDDLTGVHNRRGFLFLVQQQLAVAIRGTMPLTVLFVDVDGLKEINDVHGHERGDQALVDVARLMQQTFRASDVIGRVGGDEFAAFLLNDDSQPSVAVARFLDAIEEHNNARGDALRLSCSAGAVRHRAGEGSTVPDLLRMADEAMYEAKHAGRATTEE